MQVRSMGPSRGFFPRLSPPKRSLVHMFYRSTAEDAVHFLRARCAALRCTCPRDGRLHLNDDEKSGHVHLQAGSGIARFFCFALGGETG